jgi:hypothetical protein
MNKDVIFTCIHIYINLLFVVFRMHSLLHILKQFFCFFLSFSLSQKVIKRGCSIMTPHEIATSLPIA